MSDDLSPTDVQAQLDANAADTMTRIFAHTVAAFGTEAVKQALLPRLLAGGIPFCLLYSEPGAGSDLASVRTRAERAEGGWRITGQKVWTSGAQTAEFGLLLARTDWDAPKHKGLSAFLTPMRQAGVDVRPLCQITGERHFNEVFIDGALVPADHLLGQVNEGWKVLQSALGYERVGMGAGASERRPGSVGDNRVDLIALAHGRGRLADPLIRHQLAQAIAWRQLNALNMDRARAEITASGASSLPSLGKLAMSRILHGDARVMTAILGAASLLDGPEQPDAEDANYRALHAYMTSIGGGTDQIQRNIIAERILGLPREHEADRELPFRESRAVIG